MTSHLPEPDRLIVLENRDTDSLCLKDLLHYLYKLVKYYNYSKL